MKKIIFLSLSIFCISAALHAQTYNTAVGAKFYVANGTYGGLNIRHSITENTAVEGSLLFGNSSVAIEGLYQYQAPIPGVENLQYFAGGGGLLGFSTVKGSNVAFALRLTGGVDYKIPEVPIDVSLGLDPFFYLSPASSAQLSLGLGFRYILP